jgi:hypothetical protein
MTLLVLADRCRRSGWRVDGDRFAAHARYGWSVADLAQSLLTDLNWRRTHVPWVPVGARQQDTPLMNATYAGGSEAPARVETRCEMSPFIRARTKKWVWRLSATQYRTSLSTSRLIRASVLGRVRWLRATARRTTASGCRDSWSRTSGVVSGPDARSTASAHIVTMLVSRRLTFANQSDTNLVMRDLITNSQSWLRSSSTPSRFRSSRADLRSSDRHPPWPMV